MQKTSVFDKIKTAILIGGFFSIFLCAAANAEMPPYEINELDSYRGTYEYVLDSNNGRYELRSTTSDSCIKVVDAFNNYSVVGCFACYDSLNGCSGVSGCSTVTEEVVYDYRVRTDMENADYVDVFYCALPALGYDHNGFCLSDEYSRENTYGLTSSGSNLYKKGDLILRYQGTTNSGRCQESFENASGAYCQSGYYLSGSTCVRCANGAANGTPSFHSYGESQACASAPVPVKCSTSQYNGGNYHLSTKKCLACPSGARCDGENIYCPAGSYIYTTGTGGPAPTCVECPNGGSVSNSYTDDLEDCWSDFSGPMGMIGSEAWAYGATYGLPTTCTWTDEVVSDALNCVQIGGKDNTGEYQFINADGEFTACWYEK